MGDAILSVAQTLHLLARDGRCSDATAPTSVRIVTTAPPGLASGLRRPVEHHASASAVVGHRGHDSPVDGRLCLECDVLVRPPGPVLMQKVAARSPGWAARVRCDPCRLLRKAYYEGTCAVTLPVAAGITQVAAQGGQLPAGSLAALSVEPSGQPSSGPEPLVTPAVPLRDVGTVADAPRPTGAELQHFSPADVLLSSAVGLLAGPSAPTAEPLGEPSVSAARTSAAAPARTSPSLEGPPSASPARPRTDNDLIEDAICIADAERASHASGLQRGDRVGLFDFGSAPLNGRTGILLDPVAPRKGSVPKWSVLVQGKRTPLRLPTAQLARLPPLATAGPTPPASTAFICAACGGDPGEGSPHPGPHPGHNTGDALCTVCYDEEEGPGPPCAGCSDPRQYVSDGVSYCYDCLKVGRPCNCGVLTIRTLEGFPTCHECCLHPCCGCGALVTTARLTSDHLCVCCALANHVDPALRATARACVELTTGPRVWDEGSPLARLLTASEGALDGGDGRFENASGDGDVDADENAYDDGGSENASGDGDEDTVGSAYDGGDGGSAQASGDGDAFEATCAGCGLPGSDSDTCPRCSGLNSAWSCSCGIRTWLFHLGNLTCFSCRPDHTLPHLQPHSFGTYA